MQELTITQKFFRYFAFIHIWLAGGMILGGLSLRFFTGYHTSGFAFFAFGLSCLYMAIASGYVYQNWDLEGEGSPVYERSQRKALLMGWALGIPFWGVFGAILISAAFTKGHLTKFDIVKTPQFDKEIQRFISDEKKAGNSPIKEYTDRTLVIEGDSTNLTSVLKLVLRGEGGNKERHIHRIQFEGTEYTMVLESHRFRFGWKDYSKDAFSNPQLCELYVPFKISTVDGSWVDPIKLGGVPEFLSIKELNTLNIRLKFGELQLAEFLPWKGWGDESMLCEKAAYDFRKNNKSTSFGSWIFNSAPNSVVQYLAFPGFSDALQGAEVYRPLILVDGFSAYIEHVGDIFRNVFD